MTTYTLTNQPDGFRLAGVVDIHNANEVWREGSKLLKSVTQTIPPYSRVIGDLSGLQSSHSVTLAVLLQWYRQLAQAGYQLQLVQVPERLQAIMRASNLAEQLTT